MPDIAYPEPDYGFLSSGLMTDEELEQAQPENVPLPSSPEIPVELPITNATGNVGETFVPPPVPSSRMVPPDVTIEPVAPTETPVIPEYPWQKDIRPIPEGMESGGYDQYNLPINQTARNAAFGFGPPPTVRQPEPITPEQYRAKAYADLQEAERKEVERARLFHEDVGLSRARAERNLDNFRATTLIREQIAKGMGPQDAVALAAATYGTAGGPPPDWMLKFSGQKRAGAVESRTLPDGTKVLVTATGTTAKVIPTPKPEKTIYDTPQHVGEKIIKYNRDGTVEVLFNASEGNISALDRLKWNRAQKDIDAANVLRRQQIVPVAGEKTADQVIRDAEAIQNAIAQKYESKPSVKKHPQAQVSTPSPSPESAPEERAGLPVPTETSNLPPIETSRKQAQAKISSLKTDAAKEAVRKRFRELYGQPL